MPFSAFGIDCQVAQSELDVGVIKAIGPMDRFDL